MITWCAEPWGVTIGAWDDKEEVELLRKLYIRLRLHAEGSIDVDEIEVTADSDNKFVLLFLQNYA